MALPGPEPAMDPATTVPWPARSSCWASVTSTWLGALESFVEAGAAGMITTASVARFQGFPLAVRKPSTDSPLITAALVLSRWPATGSPGPSLVMTELAISSLA